MPRRAKTEEEKQKEKELKEIENKEVRKATRGKIKKADNSGNLRSLGDVDAKRKFEIQSMGGKASAEAKKKKKELRELTQSFLMQDSVGAVKQNLQRLGFDADDMTNLAAILGVLFTKVLNSGDLNAARTIIEWAGMSPMQQIKENEAMQKLSMIMGVKDDKEEMDDVVFYIPDNGRDDVIVDNS